MSSTADAPLAGRPGATAEVLATSGDGAVLRLATCAVAAPGPGEVLVRVAGCALGAEDLVDLAAAPPGTVPGRALCGVVSAAAPDVGDLAPGAWVVLPARPGCGACPACRHGRAEACPAPPRPRPGGLASVALVRARDLVPLTHGLEGAVGATWRLAAAGSALLLAYHALARASLMAGDLAVVAGADAVGLCAVQVAVALGASAVAVDPDEARLDAARRCGARGTLRCRDQHPGAVVAALDAWCEAEGLTAARRVVVARAGGLAALRRSVALTPPGGVLLLLGPSKQDATLPASLLTAGGLTVVALEAGHPDLLAECVALCARGAISLEAVTTAQTPDAVLAAVQQLRRGDDTRLPIICFGGDRRD